MLDAVCLPKKKPTHALVPYLIRTGLESKFDANKAVATDP